MKTLSDNLKVSFNVASLPQNYYLYRVVVKNPDMTEHVEFVGNAFIRDSQTTLTIDLKDFAIESKPKPNFLQLDDDGNIITPTKTMFPYNNDSSLSYSTRFRKSSIQKILIGVVSGGTTNYTATMYLAGYDYINKDIKPTTTDENESELCRLLQGSDWKVVTSDDVGIFKNQLLPRVPYEITDKYGVGMVLELPSATGTTPFTLSLQSGQGTGFELGTTTFNGNGTIVGLNLLFDIDTETSTVPILPPIDYEGNTKMEDFPIYLKQTNSSGDSFGDYESWNTTQYKVYYEGSSISDLYGEMYLIYKYNIPEASAISMVRREIPIAVFDNEAQAHNLENDLLVPYTYYDPDHDPMDCGYITSEEVYIPGSGYTQFVGTCPIAMVDYCPEKYYLMWEDRYGDIQSQPMKGKNNYKETYTRTEIKGYDLTRNLSELDTQPKWTLNTGWLSQDIYPFYESIMTSPKLILHDTEQNKSWNVIVTDTDYQEKKYSNNNKLINLTVNLELDKTQYMIN